jgi:hypothetical protein
LGYGEEFSVNNEIGTLYDPELDDNLEKKLSDLGITEDSFLTVIDEDEENPRVNLVLSISEKYVLTLVFIVHLLTSKDHCPWVRNRLFIPRASTLPGESKILPHQGKFLLMVTLTVSVALLENANGLLRMRTGSLKRRERLLQQIVT